MAAKRKSRGKASKSDAARKKKVSEGLKRLFLILLATGIVLVFLFNDHGLVAWYKYTREKARAESNLDSLKAEEARLHDEINRLKTDVEYLEKLAREKYGMAKEGEKVYKVIPEKDEKKTPSD